jgi:hypothetical protein
VEVLAVARADHGLERAFADETLTARVTAWVLARTRRSDG